MSSRCTYLEVVDKPPPNRPTKESCDIYTAAFRESTNNLGNFIANQKHVFAKECSNNDTIFTNDGGDNTLDIFTANLQLYCESGHFISYLPRTVYLSYVLGVPIIGNIHKRRCEKK